jgi:hypothetical protein
MILKQNYEKATDASIASLNTLGVNSTLLPKTKNTKHFQFGQCGNHHWLLSLNSKEVGVFQANQRGLFYRKVREVPLADESQCRRISFLAQQVCFGVGNQFRLLNPEDESLRSASHSQRSIN